MAGTRAGGLKARETIKKRYGPDHYIRAGEKGGANSFGADRERAKLASKLGNAKLREQKNLSI